MKILVVFMGLAQWALAAEPAQEGEAVKAAKSDVGKWSVGDCFMSEFAMTLKVDLNITDINHDQTYDVPTYAKADKDQKNCGNDTNTLSLSWTEKAKNDSSVDLKRNLVITFHKAANLSMYGVSQIVATFEVARFEEKGSGNDTNSTTHSSSLEQIWQGPLMFRTPLDRSFLCANTNAVSLKTSLRYDDRFARNYGNTTLTGVHVIFDAFRPTKNPPPKFRTPMDCDYKPNDIIPIAVGVALAALVVAVLVAYMVGRRRNMQRGYQSV